VIKLNYQLEYLPNCNEQKDDTKENEDSYKIDYESCMEREKNNKWNIYS
jgi:hypothetical protein